MWHCGEGAREAGDDSLVIQGAADARPSLITVIPAWKETLYIRDTVEALRRAAKIFPRADLIIVASGEDGTLNVARDAAKAYDLGETWVIEQRPLGKMQALADGIDLVKEGPAPDYLLLLDADTRLEPGALAIAKEFLDKRTDIVGVRPFLFGCLGGIGETYWEVEEVLLTQQRCLNAVCGGAMFFAGPPVWPNIVRVFARHDYPIHIDVQICERITDVTGKGFALAPGFRVETELAHGWSFVKHSRRSRRGQFARGNVRSFWRVLGGGVRNVLIPFLTPLLLLPFILPGSWPISVVFGLVTARALWRLFSRYKLAVRSKVVAISGTYPSYLVDNWFWSLGVVLAAVDVFVLRRKEKVRFKGYRSRGFGS